VRILAVYAGPSSLEVALYRAEQGSESLELRAETERSGQEVVEALKGLVTVDPNRTPQALLVVEARGREFPSVPQDTCFDTAFHAAMPRVDRLFALPRALSEDAEQLDVLLNEQFGRGAVSAVRKMAERRGLECEEIVAEGSPHESIILVSHEIGADLVVVGSTGVTGLERVLIGSVSQKVLLHSECPVLLVRGP